MTVLDFYVNTEPDTVLLLRSMGIEITQIILILLQYGNILFYCYYLLIVII